MKKVIINVIKESIRMKQCILEKDVEGILKIAKLIEKALKARKKILLCGNGGSAADSQHIAAELIGRFQKDRKSLPALALSTNTSTLTAIANDYGYEKVFSKQIEGLAKKGDLAIGISTSGNAQSVIDAINKAKEVGLKTVGLTGCDGGQLAKSADFSLIVPSKVTARIQESHITIGHIICELIENSLF